MSLQGPVVLETLEALSLTQLCTQTPHVHTSATQRRSRMLTHRLMAKQALQKVRDQQLPFCLKTKTAQQSRLRDPSR